MKAIALANRLARDFDAKSMIDLTADARLEILDAINGALQQLHALAPAESKTTAASLSVSAPAHITLNITSGSAEISGHTFSNDDHFRTIRIDGDGIDNQIIGPTSLLHPCVSTGTVNAVIYSDAIALLEKYAELVGHPFILETNSIVYPGKPIRDTLIPRRIGRPLTYWVEPNARNQSPVSPAGIRFDPMPDKDYRMQVEVMLSPLRVKFADLISPGAELPLRPEHVESYLLPMARGKLTHSGNWKNKDDISATRDEAKGAREDYELLTPKTLSTPRRKVMTHPGF